MPIQYTFVNNIFFRHKELFHNVYKRHKKQHSSHIAALAFYYIYLRKILT